MYTNQEYAEMAIEANNNNKLLVINDNNELKLIDIVREQADIFSENEIKKICTNE